MLIQDSSDDRTLELAKSFPVKIARVEPEDYNYGKTRNEGAAIVDGEFLIFLSTDVEIRDKSWLSKLTRHFNDPEVAGVYGRQMPKDNSTPMEQFFILNAYPAESDVSVLKDGGFKKGLVFFSNTNSAIRRSVWEQIKIPEMLKSEDQEWAKRVLLAGYKIVYNTEAIVYHSHKYSLTGVFKEYFDSGATMSVLRRESSLGYDIINFIVAGIRFVGGEYKFMLKNGYWPWIPYAIIYDFMKFLGVFLGAKQQYMLLWMKRTLCKKKNHWDTYSNVIKEKAELI